jgi:hypothetical protein
LPFFGVRRFIAAFFFGPFLECGSALLCRFGFSCLGLSRQTKRETKAAERSTAALQTQTPKQQKAAMNRRTPKRAKLDLNRCT